MMMQSQSGRSIVANHLEIHAAQIISYIFHPLLMPLLGFLVIIHSGTYVANMDYELKSFLGFVIFGLTFVMPAAFIPLYLYTRLIRNIKMPDRRERIVPMYITLIFYLVAFLLIQRTEVSRIYQNFMLSVCLTLFVIVVISFFFKVSMHLAGLGGITGLILSLSILFETDLMLYLILSVLIAGITAYARLRTNAHNPLQVYSGFILGFGCVLVVFFI